MGLNLIQEFKKWDCFPLSPLKRGGFEIYETRRGKCCATWVTSVNPPPGSCYKPYSSGIYLWMCFLILFTLLYSSSIIITYSRAFHLFSSYLCSIKQLECTPPDTYISVFINYMHVLFHLHISYPFLQQQQQKLTEWENTYTTQKVLFFPPDLPWISLCILWRMLTPL